MVFKTFPSVSTAYQENREQIEVSITLVYIKLNGLAYPKAALFGFCVALVAYNVLAVVKAALRNVHGDETIDNEVWGYYLAGSIARTYDGMMIAVALKQWANKPL